MDAHEARNAHQDSLPDDGDPFADPYNAESLRLYVAYLTDLFPNMGGERVARLISEFPDMPAPAPTKAVDAPQSATPSLPQERLRGTLRWKHGGYGYITPAAIDGLDDYRASGVSVCGNVTLTPGRSYDVEFSEGADAVSGYLNAKRIVILGNAESEAAYTRLMSKLTLPPNPVSKIRRETLYQREKRLAAEAQQRADARKNAHQMQTPSDYMDTFYEGGEGEDSKYRQDMDVRADLQ